MDVAADMTNATLLVLSSLLVVKPSKRTLLFIVFLFGKPQRCTTAPAILGFLSSTSLSQAHARIYHMFRYANVNKRGGITLMDKAIILLKLSNMTK